MVLTMSPCLLGLADPEAGMEGTQRGFRQSAWARSGGGWKVSVQFSLRDFAVSLGDEELRILGTVASEVLVAMDFPAKAKTNAVAMAMAKKRGARFGVLLSFAWVVCDLSSFLGKFFSLCGKRRGLSDILLFCLVSMSPFLATIGNDSRCFGFRF